jgi:hypothetical protein
MSQILTQDTISSTGKDVGIIMEMYEVAEMTGKVGNVEENDLLIPRVMHGSCDRRKFVDG